MTPTPTRPKTVPVYEDYSMNWNMAGPFADKKRPFEKTTIPVKKWNKRT